MCLSHGESRQDRIKIPQNFCGVCFPGRMGGMNMELSSSPVIKRSWHALPIKEILSQLQVDVKRGLSLEEVRARQAQFGPNALPAEHASSRLVVFLRQFHSPLILVLLFAGAITLLLGEYVDSAVIWGAMALNACVAFVQEWRATKALTELKKVVKVLALVRREGREQEILQEELVPGDVVSLRAGHKVPADARIFSSRNLTVQEASLTGEWLASAKITDPLAERTSLADRENMAFMGSIVEEGAGEAVVVAIGAATEIGKVAALVEDIEEEQTPYQLRLTKFSRQIGLLVAFLALFIFLEGMLTGGEFEEMFTTAVAIAVGAIPEGLPVAVTAILAIGMWRILKEKGLVRKLASAETLGSATVIATDKTLTLTEGRMEVEEIWPANEKARRDILVASALANEAVIENPKDLPGLWEIQGRPTDVALLKKAIQEEILPPELQEERSLIELIPFDNIQKYVAAVYQKKGTMEIFVAGAPERILELCLLNPEKRQEAKETLEELAGRGLRVVGVAKRALKPTMDMPREGPRGFLQELGFLGLIALKDPLRPDVKEAIAQAQRDGLKVIMITGDHLLTAKAVARELGMPAEDSNIIEGNELEELSDEELRSRLPELRVFARVEPSHKLRIVEAWQARGEVIAMTGDGINDAPALKKADIGIALGSGTDVAKEVADLVLLGDRFPIIPAAIREGRIITANIRRVITYLLSGSFTETILIGVSIVLGWPLPIIASQILWVNLVEDSLPAIALTFERGRGAAKPERKGAPLLTNEMKTIIFGIGIATDILLLGLFAWLFLQTSYTLEHIRTIIFVGLGLDSLLYVFSCKDLKRNLWQYNPFSNLYLVGAVLLGFILLAGAVYLPFLQKLLHTVPLSLLDWLILFALGIINIALIEIVKWKFKRPK